ncbi:MAG: glycosyltransferase family 4 protein [Alphaproteobacteria bacterium]
MVADNIASATAASGEAMPTVLQVLPHMNAGGVAKGVVEIGAAIGQAGGTALVASAGGAGLGDLARAGITHLQGPVDSKNPLTMRRNVAWLRKLIDTHDVDIVHARSRAPAWSAAAAARATGRPFVTTFHGTYGHASTLKRAYNRIMVRADRVIAISQHIADHIAEVYGVGEERVTVVHRGVDPAKFDPAKVPEVRVESAWRRWKVGEDQRVVLLPGRVTRWKGHTVLIEALAKLGREDVTAVMLGDVQGREGYAMELEDLAAKLGLRMQLRLPGPERDMAAAYLAADVVVSASTDPEAFGRISIEAQAMGRPVVVSDHGGSRETVIDGVTGIRVAPGDAEALAAGLATALDLESVARVRMATQAIAHVREHFTTERMCADTLAIYRELYAERAALVA